MTTANATIAAHRYIEDGLAPIPVPYKSKNPGFADWQNTVVDAGNVSSYFNGKKQNIGIRLGAPSNGRTDVDLDCPEAIRLAPLFLLQTDCIFGRSSKPRSHWQYTCTPLAETTKFHDTKDEIVNGKKKRVTLVELRSTGGQTVYPPSTHETGEAIEFDGIPGAPTVIDGGELLACVRKLAAASLLARHWPGLGSRHDTELALIGGLLRGGWNETDVQTFVVAVAEAGGGEIGKRSRVEAVGTTAARIKNGEKATGWTTLKTLIDAETVARVRGWLGIVEDGVISDATPVDTRCPDLDGPIPPRSEPKDIWPDPISLDSPKPPELPDGIFRYALGDMIDAVSAATESPRELAAGFGLAAIATMIQKRVSVRVKNDYFEPVNIWPLCAMPPGNRKSENMVRMIRPLSEWEEAKAAELLPVIEKATSERKTAELRITRLRADAAKAKREDYPKLLAEIAEMEAALPEVPRVPQLYTQDVTTEHAGTMLADNGERLSIICDEGGIFDLLAGRYSNNIPNLDVYLQAHSGSPVRVNRGSRPPVNLRHPAMTIAVSPQPEVLRGFTNNREFRGRGLLARFLYMMPSSKLGYRTGDTVAVPAPIEAAYRVCLFSLASVQPDSKDGHDVPHVLSLDGPTRELWEAFWAEIEAMMRPGGRLEHLTDWGGKLPGLVARIAGLLHCSDYSSNCVSVKSIEPATMVRAIDFGQYLIEHALIAFDLMGADCAMDAARDLWKSIEKLRRPTFTLRDAWHPLRGKYHKVSDAEPGFDVLIDHGYLMEPHQADDSESPRRRGRQPSRQFIVNPKMSEGWQ